MKRMIRGSILFAVVLTAIFLVAITGCEQGGQRIAFFQYKAGDTFISEMMDHMTARVPAGVEFEVRDAGNSQSVQNQQIVELIEEGFDLFIINAVDRLACSSIVERCAREEIPVIFFNREPTEDALIGHNAFYVGADADSMGAKQADMVAELFTDRFIDTRFDKNNDGIIQLAILKGEQGHQDAEKRTDNCVARLKELGFEVDVLAIEVADWNRRDGYEAMRRLYMQFGSDIELIFSNNDDMALGAIDYLLTVGVFQAHGGIDEQPIVIVGVDGTAVGLEAIKDGLLYGTVNNDAIEQSRAVLTLVDFILNSKDIEDFPYPITRGHYIYIDGDIITQANVADFLIVQ